MSTSTQEEAASGIIKRATHFCTQNHERLTQPRLEVLKIFAMSLKPLSAYEILEKLGEVLPSPKPPTVYRAIEFWMQHGFIHRIESMNAFILCRVDHKHLGSQFLICDDCGLVTESHIFEVPETLKQLTTTHTFTASSCNIELHGLCGSCRPNSQARNACC